MAIEVYAPVPAIRGHFGRVVETFQTQILPAQIKIILGHDPRPENWKNLPLEQHNMYEYLQRKATRPRRASVTNYINNRMSDNASGIGAFPSISIGMMHPPSFDSLAVRNQTDVGILDLDLSEENPRILLDGLARFCGAMDLIENNKDAKNWFTFPVCIYAPSEQQQVLSLNHLGQLFHDFNALGVPVSHSLAIDLDRSDPFIVIANMIGSSETVQKFGGMEKRTASLGKKSTALVTQSTLVRFAYSAAQGDILSSKLSIVKPSFDRDELIVKADICRNFLDSLSQRMGDIRFGDRTSIHLTSQGWQVLGLILHDLSVTLKHDIAPDIYNQILDEIANVNWTRLNPDWVDFIGYLENPADPSSIKLKFGGREGMIKLRDYIREKTFLQTLLDKDNAKAA